MNNLFTEISAPFFSFFGGVHTQSNMFVFVVEMYAAIFIMKQLSKSGNQVPPLSKRMFFGETSLVTLLQQNQNFSGEINHHHCVKHTILFSNIYCTRRGGLGNGITTSKE
jgi:hypothetical protein